MGERRGRQGMATNGWLDLMLIQCSCAYFGWSYAKSKEPSKQEQPSL